MAIVQGMSGIAKQLPEEAGLSSVVTEYYVESIGTVNEQAVARYIDKQRRKVVNLE